MSINYLHRNGDIVVSSPHSKPLSSDDALKLGVKDKYYGGQRSLYRKLCGVACELWYQKQHNPIFLTLTTKDILTPAEFNLCHTKWIKNLKKTYGLNLYMVVLELQERGAAHGHGIYDIPFVPVEKINKAWNSATSEFSRPSPNAVRLSPGWGGVIHSLSRVINYVCKYISKAVLRSRSRVCNYSHSLVCPPLQISDIDVEGILHDSWKNTTRYDYCTVHYTYPDKELYHTVGKNGGLKRSKKGSILDPSVPARTGPAPLNPPKIHASY